jgi:polysaccharide biosynthesis PFTS motif protein
MMRGYRMLKKDRNLDLINRLYFSFSKLPLLPLKNSAKSLFLGKFSKENNYYLNQYFLFRIYESNFNKKLLQYFGSSKSSRLIFPLPIEAIGLLYKEGIYIAKIPSLINWYVSCFYSWIKAGYIFIKIVWHSLGKISKQLFEAQLINGNTAAFLHINENSLSYSKDHTTFNILNWYISWKKEKYINAEDGKEIQIIHEVPQVLDFTYKNISVAYRRSILPKIDSLPGLIKFSACSILLLVYSLFQLLLGNWRFALMSGEIIKLLQIRYSKSSAIPRELFFNNSSWIYRPLWSYEAESKGCDVYFYFYSTNIEMLDNKKSLGWDIVTWPKYLVWDTFSRDFLIKNVPLKNEIEIEVVGPIDFVDSDKPEPQIPENSFAIFDVQPVRESFYRRLGLPNEYYTPSTSNKFINDVFSIIKSFDANFVLKRKRDIVNLIHPKYNNYINNISVEAGFLEIDPSTNPLKFINKVRGVICMPFTSVALVAHQHGIPAVFYDPIGFINPEHSNLSHGLPLLNSPEQLSQWISGLLDLPK